MHSASPQQFASIFGRVKVANTASFIVYFQITFIFIADHESLERGTQYTALWRWRVSKSEDSDRLQVIALRIKFGRRISASWMVGFREYLDNEANSGS